MVINDYLSFDVIICIVSFLFDLFYRGRAEIQKYFHLFFGSNEDIQKSF